ncbi:hypothetical protein G4G28_06835 [Massilia sp. Dwa41.01b]|uniref:hypothetical protein n=1 Tax=unclassified Massilia TaxID=2609279 RepID=UPI001600D954|nr:MULTISPECIES: hypothetical protein [unclassified Massilia]QNA88290.1 hypothetical protein G4G28_06835 [Massilia sp. Dwa41.01b]QNA99188.1 hypothetical protein G4G31_10535 [Massilia sp. Se16.2.3]
MSPSKFISVAALAVACSAQASAASTSTLPSAEQYFHHVAMAERCPSSKAATAPKLEQLKLQVLGYYQAQTANLDATGAAPLLAAIQEVEAGRVPAQVRKRTTGTWATLKPDAAKFICANMAALIDSQIAMGALALAQESRDPAAGAAAERRGIETIKSNTESLRNALGAQQGH